MAFEVVSGSPQDVWCPVDCPAGAPEKIYVGQIVCTKGDGVGPLSTANGRGDIKYKQNTGGDENLTNIVTPYGVVIGTSDANPQFDTSYLTEVMDQGSCTTLSAFTREQRGIGGFWGRDKAGYVKVALITPNTIIKGPVRVGALSTSPSEMTVIDASTSGLSVSVTDDYDCTASIADLFTFYFRTGENAGFYRIADSAVSGGTGGLVDLPFPYAIATGDSVLGVNLRPFGVCRAQFDSESMYVDVQASLAADFYFIDVVALDLSTQYQEVVYFKFNALNFLPITVGSATP